MSDPAGRGAVAVGVKGEVTTRELDRQERAIARRSAETRAVVPTVEYAIEVDAERAVARTDELGCPLEAVALAAAARCLRLEPRLNGAYRDGHHEFYGRVNVAAVLPSGENTVAVTVFDADRKSVAEIAEELEDLGDRARRGELAPAELSGSTFTFNPPANPLVSTLSPLVSTSQAAALAMGAVRDVPVLRGDTVLAGRVMTLTLACDHRIVQASHAGAFLAALKDQLEGTEP